jgi:small subunit ribosomal protein S5
MEEDKKIEEVKSTPEDNSSVSTVGDTNSVTQPNNQNNGTRQPRTFGARNNNGGGFRPRPAGERGGDRRPFGQNRKRFGDNRKKQELSDINIESQVLEVRRVSRTVKGGKKMRFSALVVAGDKEGKIGYGLSKGLDFQDAVSKATKKAKDTLVKIDINDNGSLKFPSYSKFKSSYIYIKPAQSGTGLIAGGFLRPVLQLAGVQNVYSKIVGTNNKVVGVRAAIELLKNSYLVKTN